MKNTIQYVIPAWVVGMKIKEARKAYGFSQAQLAKKMNVTPQMVSKWETGKSTPKYETLEKIAACFDSDVPNLIGISGDFHRRAPIMEYYNTLNATGKAEATKRVEELTHIDKYTKKEPSK